MTNLDFANLLVPYKDKYPRELLVEFYDYWSEKNPNGRKMRFEKEKTFDISRRLKRWNKNQKNWNKKPESAATLIQRKYGIN